MRLEAYRRLHLVVANLQKKRKLLRRNLKSEATEQKIYYEDDLQWKKKNCRLLKIED